MMRGHFAYRIVRGEFRLCTDLAEEAMQFAEKVGDAGIMMEALFLHGLTKLYRGDFVGAAQSCALALAEFDDRERTAFWATLTGENSGVARTAAISGAGALAYWFAGSRPRPQSRGLRPGALARSSLQPRIRTASHGLALSNTAGSARTTEAAGDEEMQVATEQGFQFWHASGQLYSAAGRLLRGQMDEGLRLLQKGLDAYRATGAGLGLPYYLSLLMEVFRQAGRFADARRAFDEAILLVEKNDERFQEAELHRLRGELHLAEANDQNRRRVLIPARDRDCAPSAKQIVGIARDRQPGPSATPAGPPACGPQRADQRVRCL